MRFLAVCLFLFFFGFVDAEETGPHVTVHIPMKDGVELTTDLYFPPGSIINNEYPCILLRVPAGRRAQPWVQFAALANYGYVVAFQDTRSALDAEGKAVPYLDDGWDGHKDGYDTVQWLAKSSFTNGRVGTLGCSAAGITQLMLAPTAPDSLKCQYIGQAASSLYHHAIFPGGQLQKNQVEQWLGLYAPDFSVLAFILGQPVYNKFWEKFDAVANAHTVDVPALHYGGWYDTFLQGTIDGYVSRQENGREGAQGKQKLLIGPWGHFWPMDQRLGDYVVPEHARAAPIDLSEKRWFDYYLKDISNGVAETPNVTYYVMGPFDGSTSSGNVWRHADHWPVPSVETSLFLSEDHQLRERSQISESIITYSSDPKNPVPTIGGRNLFLDIGPKDQRPIETREDVVVFTSEPLKEDLEVTGRIMAKVYFSCDTPDADIAVRLTDVYPDGRSVLISDGLSRIAVPAALQDKTSKDSPREVTVDLCSTSIVFAKGHSIRISIAGSNYPRYEKNMHVGLLGTNSGKSFVSKNKIYTGKRTPSRIILPIVRKGDMWLNLDFAAAK